MLRNGVYAACLTPLHPDLRIDVPTWARHIRWLLDNGCDGVLLFGTTGEANSFSVPERTAALEALLSYDLPPDRLMVGTGCCAVPDTARLTLHALDLGINHVLALPPFYYKSVSDEGLFQAFSRIIQQVGDDRLRLYLYHFPRMSGVPFSHELIGRLIDAFPEAIAGIKDSTGDRAHTEGLCEAFPDLQIFAGTEALLSRTLDAGGAGCISATVNVTAPQAGDVFAARTNGTASRQQELTALREAFAAFPTIPALRQVMAWRHDDDAWLHLRPPLTSLSESDARSLREALTEAGLPLSVA